MLGSMGIKGGIVFYHIGYGTTLGCPTISGVTSCQFRFWLTDVGWIIKLNCDWICDMGTPTCIVGVLVAVGGRKVMNILSLIILVYHPQKDNFWIHVQPMDNMHMLM